MKKEKMITRTIDTTVCDVKVFNVAKSTVEDVEIQLSGNYDFNEAEKELRESMATDEKMKFIMVNSVNVISKLYGMPESLFIAYATELPPRKNYSETQEG